MDLATFYEMIDDFDEAVQAQLLEALGHGKLTKILGSGDVGKPVRTEALAEAAGSPSTKISDLKQTIALRVAAKEYMYSTIVFEQPAKPYADEEGLGKPMDPTLHQQHLERLDLATRQFQAGGVHGADLRSLNKQLLGLTTNLKPPLQPKLSAKDKKRKASGSAGVSAAKRARKQ